jgi:hypothetical protein
MSAGYTVFSSVEKPVTFAFRDVQVACGQDVGFATAIGSASTSIPLTNVSLWNRFRRCLTNGGIKVYIHIMPAQATLQTGSGKSLFELPCACQSLRRLTRVVSRMYDEELRKAGLEIAGVDPRGEPDSAGSAVRQS